MERANFKRYFAHIRFEKRRLGDVSSSTDDLLCRPINADDGVPKCNEITRDWDACTTTEIENPTAADWQAVDEATQPFLTDRRNAEPFEINLCDFVVARDDYAFRIVGHAGDICRRAVNRRALRIATADKFLDFRAPRLEQAASSSRLRTRFTRYRLDH